MIKKLLIIIFMISAIFITGCATGGNNCPERNITIIYKQLDGSTRMELLKKGELDERAVMSKEKCDELLEKYKNKRIKENM